MRVPKPAAEGGQEASARNPQRTLQTLICMKETGDSEKDSICIIITICLSLSPAVRKAPHSHRILRCTNHQELVVAPLWRATWGPDQAWGCEQGTEDPEGHILWEDHTHTHTHNSPTPGSGDRPTALPYDLRLSPLRSLGELLHLFVFGFSPVSK